MTCHIIMIQIPIVLIQDIKKMNGDALKDHLKDRKLDFQGL